MKADAAPAANLEGLGFHELNAMLNLYGKDGGLQLSADKEAARQYFLQNVNQNMV